MATRNSTVSSAFGAATTVFDTIGSTASVVGNAAKMANNYVEQVLYEQEKANSIRRTSFDRTILMEIAQEAAQKEWSLNEAMGKKLNPEEKDSIFQSHLTYLKARHPEASPE